MSIRRSTSVLASRVIVRCTGWAASAKFASSMYASALAAADVAGRDSNAVTATFGAGSNTECTTTAGSRVRGTAPSVKKCTAAPPATSGHRPSSPPAGARRARASSTSWTSVVAPCSMPDAVEATTTSPGAPRANAVAAAMAFIQRVPPPAVAAAIDQEESMTTRMRPASPDAREAGRAIAAASATAITTVIAHDTARRNRSHHVRLRSELNTRRQTISEGTLNLGGRTLIQKIQNASAPAATTKSHAAKAPVVTRESLPAGRCEG